jgi:glutamyl endopeptidase
VRLDQTAGFRGTAPSAVSPTFQERGLVDRPAGPLAESAIGADDRVPVSDPENLPWRVVCALRITGQTGSVIPGTGWLAGPRTVITAGHCVFDRIALAGFAHQIVVTPGLNSGVAPFGQVTATKFKTLQQWADSADPEFDIGGITLDTDLGTLVGFFSAAARQPSELESRLAHVAGYPQDPGAGVRQFHHFNRIVSGTNRRLFYETDTSRGQSGAPVWVLESNGGTPLVVGVHTYGVEKTPPELPPCNSATLINDSLVAQIAAWVEEDLG